MQKPAKLLKGLRPRDRALWEEMNNPWGQVKEEEAARLNDTINGWPVEVNLEVRASDVDSRFIETVGLRTADGGVFATDEEEVLSGEKRSEPEG